MKTILIILSLGATFVFTNCSKITNTTWVYYDETGCSDPWGQNTESEKDKKKNIEKYLNGKKIKTFKIEIVNDGMQQACKACSCKSGKRIHCKIKTSDVNAMKDENFYQ